MRSTLFRRRHAAIGIALAVGLLIGTAAAGMAGSGTPANKATAAGGKTVEFGPGKDVELLSATLHTSKPEDLILQVSLECSILSNVVIEGGPPPAPSEEEPDPAPKSETDGAGGRVRVWVEVDGDIVPIKGASEPPQDPAAQVPGDETDKVTFCDRTHARTVIDEEDEPDGLDEQRDYQRTKSANAFNWLRFNAGSGDHTVKVMADLEIFPDDCTAVAETEPVFGSTEVPLDETCAEAYVGNRTIIIEPTKTANNAIM